jgi:protein-S-isoprenylcysteine O-methyltransferase Ste14
MRAPWWKNSCGELYVLGQFLLFLIIAFGKRSLSILPVWSPLWQKAGTILGIVLMITGAIFLFAGAFNLGRNLTPFICPKGAAVLLKQGAYRFVRHPIYSGILQISFGWAFLVHGWLTLFYTLCLLVLFDMKIRKEEKALRFTFPGYELYARKVKKLIPFIY